MDKNIQPMPHDAKCMFNVNRYLTVNTYVWPNWMQEKCGNNIPVTKGNCPHRKRRQRTEKEQMSVPLPAMAVKMPPTKPLTSSTTAFHRLKLGMESYVFLLYCLLGNYFSLVKLTQVKLPKDL
jgi:hypothetical protein